MIGLLHSIMPTYQAFWHGGRLIIQQSLLWRDMCGVACGPAKRLSMDFVAGGVRKEQPYEVKPTLHTLSWVDREK